MAVPEIALAGLLSGVIGASAGGLLGLCFRRTSRRNLSFLLALTAGMMLAVSAVDLLPEALLLGGPLPLLTGSLAGVAAAILLQQYLPGENGLLKTGKAVAAGMTAHNLCEGLAIGSGFAASPSLGWSLTLVMLFHEVPEGLSLSLPLAAGGMGRGKVLTAALLSGLPTGLGALTGALCGQISPTVVGFLLALAGGMMLYLSFGDLIPSAGSLSRGRLTHLGCVLGLLLGMALCYLV